MESVYQFKTIFNRHTDILWILNEKSFEVDTPGLKDGFNFLKEPRNKNNSPLKYASIFSKNLENNSFSDLYQLEKNLQESNIRKLVLK